MKEVTIKTITCYGRPATPATEKQQKLAEDIVARINSALAEVAQLGFTDIAEQVAEQNDKLTNCVEAGAKDVIEYLKNVDRFKVFSQCYSVARRNHNSAAIKALNPRAIN